jgi:hypothetical protein
MVSRVSDGGCGMIRGRKSIMMPKALLNINKESVRCKPIFPYFELWVEVLRCSTRANE